MKVEWNFVIMASGEQFVMMDGTVKTLELYVDS